MNPYRKFPQDGNYAQIRSDSVFGHFGHRLAAARHNHLGLTEPLDTSIRGYHRRPFQILDAKRFATALRAIITDSKLRAMPWGGGIDQFVGNGEILANTAIRRRYLARPRGQEPAVQVWRHLLPNVTTEFAADPIVVAADRAMRLLRAAHR